MLVDSSGQSYEKIEILDGHVRVTYIPNGWADLPSIRIQIQDGAGHLRQGPEIPLTAIGDVAAAVVKILSIR